MRKNFGFTFVLFVIMACFSVKGLAIDFKAGTYYIDNTKLQYSNIKFVVETNNLTRVYNMSKLEDKDWWKVELLNDVNNVDGYCFINSNQAAGTYTRGIEDFLETLSLQSPTFRHTKVRNSFLPEAQYPIGWVFCPLNIGEISDGYWRPIESYCVTPSHTLPIIYIDTQGSQTISTKDYYINGTFWLDNCGIEGYESLGSQESPLEIEIKGRGNYTWFYMYKKPYKVKFINKQSPLGLDRSKHFILLHNDDWSGRLRNETGFELSRQLGMPYTPRQIPVELVLNGEYEGLYFLCEKIRVESGRVDIMEQQDNDSNPDNATGGWLLEIGYDDKKPVVIEQFENNDITNNWFAFTSNSPEVLSQVQYGYIHNIIHRADSCIFVPDKTDTGWEEYFDIKALARFYVIQEVTENVESFSRSLIMYKDYGWNEKLHFGPVWDFDNSFYLDNNSCDHFIFEYELPFSFLWIKELLKFPRLQQKIREVWKEFKENEVLQKINEHALQWRSTIEEAELNHERVRWPFYSGAHDMNSPARYLDKISRKVAWLDAQWSVPVGDVNCDGMVTAADVTAIYDYMLMGDETYSKSTCDINGDGDITAADITALYDIMLGN